MKQKLNRLYKLKNLPPILVFFFTSLLIGQAGLCGNGSLMIQTQKNNIVPLLDFNKRVIIFPRLTLPEPGKYEERRYFFVWEEPYKVSFLNMAFRCTRGAVSKPSLLIYSDTTFDFLTPELPISYEIRGSSRIVGIVISDQFKFLEKHFSGVINNPNLICGEAFKKALSPYSEEKLQENLQTSLPEVSISSNKKGFIYHWAKNAQLPSLVSSKKLIKEGAKNIGDIELAQSIEEAGCYDLLKRQFLQLIKGQKVVFKGSSLAPFGSQYLSKMMRIFGENIESLEVGTKLCSTKIKILADRYSN
jgi:hypothetical protein